MLNETKIQRRFPRRRLLSKETLSTQNEINNLFQDFTRMLDKKLPDGRLKALTFTHLETSGMFAMKALEDEANSKLARAKRKKEEAENRESVEQE